MKLCFHAKLYQMDNIFFIWFAVRCHELSVGMDVQFGDYASISFHMKLKCAKLYINSSTNLVLNLGSELQVAFS
jgi:hypothetical protein